MKTILKPITVCFSVAGAIINSTAYAAAGSAPVAVPSVAMTQAGGGCSAEAKTPDWVKDLVIYEIATKSFNSPGGPEKGTFKSVKEKLPYLRDLGVNAIWMSGNNLADAHHFYNIWTQYACIRQDTVDPSLGTEQDLADLTAEAHRNGIRVFLDVISHGVMNGSPLIKEHPEWFKGGSWGMTDFDWYGGHKDLDEWWVKTFTDYVVKDGIDGYRVDVRIYRPDLWRRIKANALAAGREIVVISESVAHCTEGVADVYQVWGNFCRNNQKDTRNKGTQVCDVGRYYSADMVPSVAKWEARHKHKPGQRHCRFLVSFALSCHDNGWDAFASGGNPYQVRGSRAWMGYSSFFAPAIPIFFSGEEFNAKYVPIPHLSGSLYGDKRPGDGYWLYGSWLQWDQLNDRGHREMLEDAKRMLAIRREYRSLMHAWWTDGPKGIVRVPPKTARPPCDGVPFPVPYILHGGGKAVLVAANPTDSDIELDLAIPFDAIGMHSAADVVLTDVWNRDGRVAVPAADGSVRLPIRRDRVARGGIGVWEIQARKPMPWNLIAHTGESEEAPGNTMEAFRLAVDRGFGFECDLQLSKDGRVFTFHDDDFKRITDGAYTAVCKDATWDEIKARAEVGRDKLWAKRKEFASVRPALLEDVLSLARDGRWIFLEVKYPGTEIVPRIKEVLERQSNATENNVLFISFHRDVCKALAEQLPQYKTCWLTTEYQEDGRKPITVDYAVGVLRELGADGIDVRYLKRNIVTPQLVKGIQDAGFDFHVWTIDRLDLAMEAFRKGVQTVTTNRPKKLLDEYR